MVHTYDYLKDKYTPGLVREVTGSTARAHDLPGVMINELVAFEGDGYGMVMSVEKDVVDIMALSHDPIHPGTHVVRSGRPLTVTVDDGSLGKTLDPLGHVLESWKTHHTRREERPIFTDPPSIADRKRVTRFLETGIGMIDLLIPLGQGQRELFIGDRKTGKSKLLQQIALHQAKNDIVVIIAMIGKRAVDIKTTENFLEEHGARRKCVIVATTADQSPGEIILTPYTAMAIAEHFRDEGRNSLIILDDLTTHARYYRELSLVAGRFPGRESYPGDIFHTHSELLERAGNFILRGKEASISCIPLAETVGGDMTGYIQTNLMSMTDGHIYLDSELFYRGIRPAINTSISVTRVGRQTQTSLMRDISQNLQNLMKRYDDAQRFLRFGPELTDSIRATLQMGESFSHLLNQSSYARIPINVQLVLVALLYNLMWDGKGAKHLSDAYETQGSIRTVIDEVVGQSKTLDELKANVRPKFEEILKPLTEYRYANTEKS